MMSMSLFDKIRTCTRCNLCKDMPGTSPVPGIGPLDANIMLIGEALGKDESILEEPFVGDCGQFLDLMLDEAELRRDELFITNTVKCRPTKNSGRSNRPPEPCEIASCKPWLWQELQMVEPKVVVTLGKIPTYTLLSSQLIKSFKLGDVVGNKATVDYMNSTIIPCYHPSYIMVHGKDKRDSMVKLLKQIKDDYA